MRPVFGGLILLIVVAGGTAIIFKTLDFSSRSTYTSQSGSVRLSGS